MQRMREEPRGVGRKKETGSRGEAAFDPHLEERVSADTAGPAGEC